MMQSKKPPMIEYKENAYQVHLSDYLAIVRRRIWLIALIFMMVVGLAALYSFTVSPTYKASALVLIDKKPSPDDPLGNSPDRYIATDTYYTTQIDLLSHRTLVQSVIDQLNLEQYYKKMLEDSKKFHLSDYLPFLKRNAQPQIDPQLALSEQVMKWYMKNLDIEPVRNSSLVKISFSGSDPQMTAKIINTHAQKAIESTVSINQQQAKSALDWLQSQVDKQKKAVEDSQRKIYEFKKENDILTLDDNAANTRPDISTQELSELNTELTRAKADRIAKQSVYLQLKNVSSDDIDSVMLPEITADPVVVNLRNQLVTLKANQIEMASKYGPRHPKMMELASGIKQTKAELDRELRSIRQSIKIQADRAASVETRLEQLLEKRKQAAMNLGEKVIQYQVLREQAASNQDIYNLLLKQERDINLASVMNSSNLRVIDKARVPILPDSPKIALNLVLAAALAGILGLALAFFAEYMDNTVKTPLDLSIRLGMPTVAMVPYHKGYKWSKRKQLPMDRLSGENLKGLPFDPLSTISNRLPAEFSGPAAGIRGRAIAVESVTMDEGKSMVATRMASSMADAGLRVILLDGDLQRPSLKRMFGLNKNGGSLENIVRRILTLQLKAGSLKDFSIDDLFFLISLKRLNGQLAVKSEDQTIRAWFQNGQLLHMQNSNNPEGNRIGNMLLQGKFISKDQLEHALERHRRTGQPLGYILVNSGYINRHKLKGPLRLQMEEHIQKLFSWKTGQFAFKQEDMRANENEMIFFGEDYSQLIENLGRVAGSKMIRQEILGNIQATPKENIYLLGADGTLKKPFGTLNRVLAKKLLDVTRDNFDVVLIDTPPLDAQTGIESLFAYIDGVVVVIKAGHLSYRLINNAVTTLPQDKIIGAVLNQVKDKSANYGYYYNR